jgi:hypothetical protein
MMVRDSREESQVPVEQRQPEDSGRNRPADLV